MVARRRPFTVEAVRFDDPGHASTVTSWVIGHRHAAWGVAAHGDVIILSTSRGRRRVELGEWVVFRGAGDFEVLSNAAFHDQYDLVGFDE